MASYKELKAKAEDLMRQAEAAKYGDPAAGATWSGRGRLPHWLTDEVGKGKKKEEFLVG